MRELRPFLFAYAIGAPPVDGLTEVAAQTRARTLRSARRRALAIAGAAAALFATLAITRGTPAQRADVDDLTEELRDAMETPPQVTPRTLGAGVQQAAPTSAPLRRTPTAAR